MIEYIDPGVTFSRAVKHNGILYFSGHCDGGKHRTIEEQTQLLLDRYEELLKAHGSDKDHLLFVSIYLPDLSLKERMNTVWNAWINPKRPPARVCVEAKIPEGYLLEMCVTAAVAE